MNEIEFIPPKIQLYVNSSWWTNETHWNKWSWYAVRLEAIYFYSRICLMYPFYTLIMRHIKWATIVFFCTISGNASHAFTWFVSQSLFSNKLIKENLDSIPNMYLIAYPIWFQYLYLCFTVTLVPVQMVQHTQRAGEETEPWFIVLNTTLSIN